MDDSTFRDMSRSARAAIWVGFYVLCWMAMGLSCRADLPPNCLRASEPMEVLTELPVLLVFALSQASVLRRRPELARSDRRSKDLKEQTDIRRLVYTT